MLGIAAGAAYGLVMRFAFGAPWDSEILLVMSLAFIFMVPLALGFISIHFGGEAGKKSWFRCLFQPWIASFLFLFVSLLLTWEGLICIIIWLPLVLGASSVGGFFAGLTYRLTNSEQNRNYCLIVVAFLPFLVAPLEKLRASSFEVRPVNTQIRIHASPATVWQNIRSVPLIKENEHSRSFSGWLGFPRPLEATLTGEGVGAIRHATFEGGVLFVETITEWDEPHRLAFSIRADTANIPPKTFDEHVIIGGRYFDVLNGTYTIETLGPNEVILHLASEQRLSTGFNFYSRFWTEALMADIQNYILKIIKQRCEHP